MVVCGRRLQGADVRGEAGRVRRYFAEAGRAGALERIRSLVGREGRNVLSDSGGLRGRLVCPERSGHPDAVRCENGRTELQTAAGARWGKRAFTSSPWAYNGRIFCL